MTTNAIGCAPYQLKRDRRHNCLTPISLRAGVRDVSSAGDYSQKPEPARDQARGHVFARYALGPREIQKMPPCPVLGLHDSGIGSVDVGMKMRSIGRLSS